ncbi:MAG: transporter substrate-binding domain-containing protein [Holophaga sp.]|nr:transporter substrate-binding domain-containing protein [Holophaga sp.]
MAATLVSAPSIRTPVVVGINAYKQPFEYLDSRGEPAGYDVDLIKAVAKEMDLPLVFRTGTWSDMLAGLEAGNIDLEAMLYSEDRAKALDFSTGHLVLHYAMFMRKGAPWVDSLKELRGRRVAVERGSWIQAQLVAMGLGRGLDLVDSHTEALEQVARGAQDAAVVPRMLGLEVVRDRNLANLQPVGPLLFSQDLCFAVPKGHGELLAALETGLARLNRSGAYYAIYDKWFGHMDPEAGAAQRNRRRAVRVALGALVLAALLVAWSWSLKRQVRQRTQALRRANAAIRANEQFLTRILETMPLALFGKDPNDQFRYVLFNPKAEEVFGYSRDQVLHKTDFDLYPEERAEAYWEIDLLALGQGATVEVPEHLPGGDGRGPIHLHTRKATILDAEGRPRLVLGITEDVTARKRMEAELKHSRESLAKAQELAEIGNWDWELATGEVRWSDQMFRILGWDPGAVPPSLRTIMARTHPDDRPAFGRSLRRLLVGREVLPMDFRVVLEDGSPRCFHSLLEAERGADGKALRLRGTLQDVTERRTTEEAFRQAQKLESLGVLAGGIAHDFNNLLSAIGGNLELAQMHMRPEPDAAPFLTKIEKILKRASELTHQMLAYSGKGRLLVKKLSLNQIAEEMPHLLEVSISKRVRLDYQFEPNLPPIEADAAQLQQVIMNLVTNASESIGDRDGTITLTTGMEYLANPQDQVESHGWSLVPGLYITLEVADTGCGMSPETRRRLFDPFFTTKFSGRGLGLSAMLGILKGHNAGIRIRSREGEGSSFKLFFPASVTGGLPPVPAPRAPRPAAAAGSILLVDDEPDILEATTELLAAMDFKVVPARDGLEAVELFRANPQDFSLVLMDLTMPRMGGREAFHLMREREPGMKIVLCSGFNETDVAKDFPYPSLAGFLQKPYTFKMLQDVVQQALG